MPKVTFKKVSLLKEKKDKTEQKLDNGLQVGDLLDNLAAFEVLEKILEEGKQLKGEVRELVVAEYKKRLMEEKKRPETFAALGNESTAMCEMRKRSSQYPIDNETAEKLKALGIPLDQKDVIVESHIAINPKLDQKVFDILIESVQKDPVLSKHFDDIFIQHEEEPKFCTSDNTFDALAQKGDTALTDEVLEKIATFAINKYKFNADKSEPKRGAAAPSNEAKAEAIKILKKLGVLPN